MCLMYMYAEILIKISIFYKNDTGQSEKYNTDTVLSKTCRYRDSECFCINLDNLCV